MALMLKRNESKGNPLDERGVGYDGWSLIDQNLHDFTHGDAIADAMAEVKFQKHLKLLNQRKKYFNKR